MALHRAISEIVRFTHDDMGVHGWDTAAFHTTAHRSFPHVILTPFGAAQGRLREGSHRMASRSMARCAAATIYGDAPRNQ
jgi:hypothetical protein